VRLKSAERPREIGWVDGPGAAVEVQRASSCAYASMKIDPIGQQAAVRSDPERGVIDRQLGDSRDRVDRVAHELMQFLE
jgi:hypothetical protein